MNEQTKNLIVEKTTRNQSKINYAYVNPCNYINECEFLLIEDMHVFMPAPDKDVGKNEIRLSRAQREYLGKSLNDSIEITYTNRRYFEEIKSLKISLEMVVSENIRVDANDFNNLVKQTYNGFPFTVWQQLYIEIQQEERGVVLLLRIESLETDGGCENGILSSQTNITVNTTSHRIELINNGLLKDGLSLERLGIGGMRREFDIMFRRAFVQRLFGAEVIRRLGAAHVKGIILHGPPGTGKTLIARQLGRLLNSREPKIVNGPEILNKYVGQSEENIRNLFREAEEEYARMGERSQLHIIIFDEIDAICKRRGLGGPSGIGDQVVTQLLSKIDGVRGLDNVLLVGMTNRLDLIDEALLRPGRFEIHLEIGLPDEEARHEIFVIHTQKMNCNNHMDGEVDLPQLAKLAKNYTGAEIEAVVRAAIGYALERVVGSGLSNGSGTNETSNIISADGSGSTTGNCSAATSVFPTPDGLANAANASNVIVTQTDFLKALDDVKPAFGIDERAMEGSARSLYETETTRSAMKIGHAMLARLCSTDLYNTNSLLFYGAPGSGKSTIATKLALQSGFSFIKLISPADLVGLSESAKISHIKECFVSAYKSEGACLILDDIEGLIEFVSIGPRFLNAVLQAIKIFVKGEGRNKLFIFGTTANPEIMRECGIFECFGDIHEVSYCGEADYHALCLQNPAFETVEYTQPVSIKKLMSMLDNDKAI